MKTRTVILETISACGVIMMLAIASTETFTKASTPHTTINGLGTIEMGQTSALFFSGDGNPPNHYPALDGALKVWIEQESRKAGIRYWLTDEAQLGYPLTEQEKRWLTNSLAQVDGWEKDTFAFFGPYIFTVGPPPQ